MEGGRIFEVRTYLYGMFTTCISNLCIEEAFNIIIYIFGD